VLELDKVLERTHLVLVDALVHGLRVYVADGEYGDARQLLLVDAAHYLVSRGLVVADHVQQHTAHALLHCDFVLVFHADVFHEAAAELLGVDVIFDFGLGILVLADGHAPEFAFVFQHT